MNYYYIGCWIGFIVMGWSFNALTNIIFKLRSDLRHLNDDINNLHEKIDKLLINAPLVATVSFNNALAAKVATKGACGANIYKEETKIYTSGIGGGVEHE